MLEPAAAHSDVAGAAVSWREVGATAVLLDDHELELGWATGAACACWVEGYGDGDADCADGERRDRRNSDGSHGDPPRLVELFAPTLWARVARSVRPTGERGVHRMVDIEREGHPNGG
jgi:hypothetical protein